MEELPRPHVHTQVHDNMRVGGYTLHLYCDTLGCTSVGDHNIKMEFYAQTSAHCNWLAKQYGWHVGYRHQYCPCCTGAKVFESDLGLEGWMTYSEMLKIPEGEFSGIITRMGQ